MSRAVTLTILLAGLIVIGSSTPVWAAQMDARINPNSDTSPFKMNYQKTVFIEYPNGGELFDVLQGKEWSVIGTADSSDPGVKNLMKQLNDKIKADGSQAHISDLNVSYDIHLKARNINTSVDYRVIIEGTLTNYVITKDAQKTLIDLGWRGLTANDDVVIGGHEINFPISILLEEEPEAAEFFVGTEAEDVLHRNLINADFILQQPLTNWHFLFDPTGINVDAGTFGLSDEISGYVVSIWTMGESSLREGIQKERVFEAEIVADQPYVVRSVQSSDQGNLYAIGFGALDVFDGIEIAGVTPTPPSDYATTSTGDFPVMIIYGMAAMAAIAGGAFFMFSSRALKNTKEGQQGIDPNRLQGYQTSSSSGGYKTNRGEAQLKDDSSYQQTRSVYDQTSEPTPPPPPQPEAVTEEAACGCAASADMGSECDCAMQGACLCDATCGCDADICKEQANSMS